LHADWDGDGKIQNFFLNEEEMIKRQCKLVEDRLLEIFKKENEVNSTNDVSNVKNRIISFR
jgi:hypothetical protein